MADNPLIASRNTLQSSSPDEQPVNQSESNRSRRAFLKGAAVAGAGALSGATSPQVTGATPRVTSAVPLGAAQHEGEVDTVSSAGGASRSRPGSDYMVDVLKSLDIEYYAANPASTLKSLHESIINYAGNRAPEFITCTHEEASVAIANGYFKISGKPMAVGVHGTVGSQHASMAVYNAYCDRAPVLVLLGNIQDAAHRHNYVDWLHSSQDVAAVLREYTKWDDAPVSLSHFAESTVRAYRMAMTPPQLPVAIVCDEPLQQQPVPADFVGRIPKRSQVAYPTADPATLSHLAQLLAGAQAPVLVAGRCARTQAGLDGLLQLAELLQAPVVDEHFRLNFPTHHPLNYSFRAQEVVSGADVILGLEVNDLWGALHTFDRGFAAPPASLTRAGAVVASISSLDLFTKSVYQNFQRFEPADLAVAADAEATLPFLIEALQRSVGDAVRHRIDQRRAAHTAAWKPALAGLKTAATFGWDASPISTARLSMELWDQLRHEDWSLVNDTIFLQHWPLKLWDMTKHYQFIGGRGGEGLGYGPPAAVGAALANRKSGRISVNIQGDGDFMYCPGALWTAAHHRVPLLTIMHNNRAYMQETMLVQRMAGLHQRPIESAWIGTTLADPYIDYARMAMSMGVEAEGPIADPAMLSTAIRRGIAAVKEGRPYLIDVLTQPR
jgi:acetolactate synthase I/II/III large subunit